MSKQAANGRNLNPDQALQANRNKKIMQKST